MISLTPKPYYLIDNTRNIANRLRIKYCEIASKIFLFKGRKGLTNDILSQMWDLDGIEGIPPPSVKTVIRNAPVPYIKWYIRNHIKINASIWNGDFVAGLTTAGKVSWFKTHFPAFKWSGNTNLANTISDSPFSGKIIVKKSLKKYGENRYIWSHVPSLYLPYSRDSISFMAGVLATGQQRYIDGEAYIYYDYAVIPYFVQWSIPIEINCEKGIYISPIWPALLSYLMPESYKPWTNLPDAYKADFYAAILWNVYTGKMISRRRIPYLKSRQWTYNNKGDVKRLEELWIECKLAGLDKRIKEAIHHWAKTV